MLEEEHTDFNKHEGLKKNTQALINCMNKYFRKYIKRYYDTYASENNSKHFEQRFCEATSICNINEDGTLHVSMK